MKKFAFVLLLAGCAATGPSGRASECTVRAVDGRAVAGASLWKGRETLLVFMTSW